MRAVGVVGVLCVLSSLALLGAAPASGWAAPAIGSYSITHMTSPCGYRRHVCVTVSDDAVTVELIPPGGSVPIVSPSQQCGWSNGDGTSVYAWDICLQSEPTVGTYLFRATGPDGETVLESGATTAFPSEPMAWAPPMPDTIFDSTRPTLSWLPYTVFPSDAPDSDGGKVANTNITVGSGAGTWFPLLSRDCLQGDRAYDTSWAYGPGVCASGMQPDELWPGRAYAAQVEVVSVGHPLADGGWYNEGATTGAAQFAVAGPTPLFEYTAITRGVRLFPDGRRVYGERAYVTGVDLNGGDQLRFEVHDPPNLFRKQAGTLELAAAGGFGAVEIWGAYTLPSLASGPYVVAMTDRVTDQELDLVYHITPPVAPTIASPSNGAVIPAGAEVEFTWQPLADQCTCQVWLEEIPPSDLGEIFEWSPWIQTLTFLGSRAVWCPWAFWGCLPGDATSVVYGSGPCAEPLQSGHRYRFHVMVSQGQGEPLSPMWPNYPMRTISESMVDFTVE